MTGARESGTEMLLRLGEDLPAEFGITTGRMFNTIGLKTGASFFAFVSNTDRLVVKLPAAEIALLVGDGEAEPVTMGKRTMREWVSLPRPDDEDAPWRSALETACAFVHPL